MKAKKGRIIIATGGTGGHIFSARSTALELSKRGFKVTIFADNHYKKYSQKEDPFNYYIINSSTLRKGTIPLIKASYKISLGIIKAFLLMLFYQPKIIIAFGGYASFPSLATAIVLKRKIILHEQNAYFGKVNRLLARFATKIALSYKKTYGIEEKYLEKTIYIGNPIRDDIIELNKYEYNLPGYNKKKPLDNLGYDVLLASQFHNHINEDSYGELFNILVIGGSGGAKIFSDILPKAFFNIRDELKKHINIVQQCRKEYIEDTFSQYQSFNLNILINTFFKDIKEEIKRAHLIIARAGSSSIAEFTAAKKPLILVPFAAATDDHQTKNAAFIEKSGGAIVFKEKDFTINKVTKCLEKLIDNPALLKKMSKASYSCANINANKDLANLIESLL